MLAIAPNPSPTHTDLEVVERSLGGHRDAQRQIFAEQRSHAHRVLYRIMGSNAEVEDLVQDTMVQVFRSLKNYRGESSLSSWVARIATRVAFAHIRKRPPRSVGLDELSDPVSHEPRADQQLDTQRASLRLYEVLHALKPKYRIAYALHVIDGRPLKEVASLMDASLVATKSRVWRARNDIDRRAAKDPVLKNYLVMQGVAS